MARFWTGFIYSPVWERAYDARLELRGEIFPVMTPLCHPFALFFSFVPFWCPTNHLWCPIRFAGLR
jgi:hypothetical protein